MGEDSIIDFVKVVNAQPTFPLAFAFPPDRLPLELDAVADELAARLLSLIQEWID
jgi:hypothetical protein